MRMLVIAVAALVPFASAAAEPTGATPAAAPRPVSLLPAPSQPAGSAARSYLFAKLGAVFPSDEHMTGFENGPAVEAGAGYRLTPNFALEGGLGYFQTTERMSADGFDPGAFHVEDTLHAVPLLASLRISGRAGDVEFFGLLGGGLYFLSLHEKVSASSTGTWSGSASDTTLGVHVGAGVAAYVSSSLSLGVEARYLYAEAEFGGGTSRMDSTFLTATLGYRL